MNESIEQKERRRRWLSLAEIVGVGGLLIAGAGLYFSWSDRQEARQTQAASSAADHRLTLAGTPQDGGRTLLLADARQELSDVIVTFPPATGIAEQRPAGDPVIAADGLDDVMLRLTDGGADERTGRLPVLITATFSDGDDRRNAAAIYDIVWRTHGRFGRGRELTLTGLRLRQRRVGPGALDAAWAREKP